MNERIRELADQAFDTAEYPADQQYRIEPNSAFCKKFAELIIKECTTAIESTDRYRSDYFIAKIREHFGVES